jgi:hypothetical protein
LNVKFLMVSFCLPPACLLVLAEIISLTLRWRRYVPLKHRLQLNGLHGVISQKIILFINTAVKTSNPTINAIGRGRRSGNGLI